MGTLDRGSEWSSRGCSPGHAQHPAHTVLPLCPHPAGGGVPRRTSSSWCLVAGSRRVTQKWRSDGSWLGLTVPRVGRHTPFYPLGSGGRRSSARRAEGLQVVSPPGWGRHCAPPWPVSSSCTWMGDSPDLRAPGGGWCLEGVGRPGSFFLVSGSARPVSTPRPVLPVRSHSHSAAM